MNIPQPQKPHPRRVYSVFSAAVLAAMVIFGGCLAVLFWIPGQTQSTVITDIAYPIIDGLATTALFFAARRSWQVSKRLGTAWAMIAFAQLVFTLGDVVWAVLEVGLKQVPYPSVVDSLYFAVYPLLMVGVLLLPTPKLTRVEWLIRILDIAIVMIVAVLGFWIYQVSPILIAHKDISLSSLMWILAFPVGDLIFLWSLLVIIYWQSREQIQKPLWFLMAANIVMIATHVAFNNFTLSGSPQSSQILDIGAPLTVLLSGLAGVLQFVTLNSAEKSTPADLNRSKRPGKFGSLLPYLPFAWIVMAFFMLIQDHLSATPENFTTLAVGVGSIILLVLTRQIIVFRENFTLNEKLQQALEDGSRQASALQSEIIQRERAELQLVYDATHDALTGLPNRVLFMDRLERAIAYSRRRVDCPFSVLFLDLDDFKVINDSLGHSCGDLLLKTTAERLIDCVRISDTVARLGGDEFVILLEDDQDFASIKAVADRIQAGLREPIILDDHQLFITASIGMVPSVIGYNQPQEVLRDADIAMYRAKALGKARYEIFDAALRNQAVARLEIENDLRLALESKKFVLHYQPIFSLKSDRVIGFEALLRWDHPKHRLTSPAEFIPIAEETGLIVPIGKWALQEACTQIKNWQIAYAMHPPLQMSVNISGKQFSQPDFTEQIESVLHQTGLDPSSLVLEITETVFIDSAAKASAVFSRLCDLGIKLQIDDFGTGYSSLGYINHFPIDTIKIDQSFVQQIGESTKNTELVHTMVTMAHDLGMEAIAEGIESEVQLQELIRYGCNYGQGYYLSTPLASPSVEMFLEGRRRSAEGIQI